MTKYEIRKNEVEIRKGTMEIKPGCTIGLDESATLIESFDNLEDALVALEKYESSCTYYGWTVPFYKVEECVVEMHEYDDEDDEWLSGGDVYGTSKGLENYTE